MEIIDVRNIDLIRDPRRVKFYEDNLTVGKFDDLYKSKFPGCKLGSFKERFVKYTEEMEPITIWAPLVIVKLDGSKKYRNIMKSVSTNGEIVLHSNSSITKGSLDRDGYLVTGVGKVLCKVHRCILSSFCLDTFSPGLTGDHGNHIKTDNCLANLSWMSNVDNVIDGQNGPNGMGTRPISIEVVIDKFGDPIGTKMSLLKRSALREFGISPRKFKEKLQNVPTEFPHGCKVTYDDSITETNLSDNFIKFFKDKFPY